MHDHKRYIRTALLTALAISLGAVLWFFMKEKGPGDPSRAALPKLAAKSLMALSKVHQTATRNGTVQWELEAATAELEADTGSMVLGGPRIEFHLEDGTRVYMTADKGILNTKSNDMEVLGNVRLRNDRYALATTALAYQHDRQLITARTPVEINGPSVQLHAAAMTYDLKTNQTQFAGPVEGVLHEHPVM